MFLHLFLMVSGAGSVVILVTIVSPLGGNNFWLLNDFFWGIVSFKSKNLLLLRSKPAFPAHNYNYQENKGNTMGGNKKFRRWKKPPQLYSPIVPGFGDLIMEEKFS